MYSVIFVEPESSGNIGALARVMKNFGLGELILVNPKCKIDNEAKGRAKHAYDIIQKARVVKRLDSIGKFDFVIGTTGKRTQHYNEIRSAITPRELAEKTKRGRIALVFGREGIGLTNEELAGCDIIVHIPTDSRYPVMNISHAAAIVFYELFSSKKEVSGKAGKKEKEALFRNANEIVERLSGIRDKKKIAKIFRNVVNRSLIEGKEAHALSGMFGEIKKKL